MMDVNKTPPEKMTTEQRRQEIASLLANGLIRLRNAYSLPSPKDLPESEFELDSSGHRSVHSNPVNKTKTESK
ncbi:hypothetical protein C7H79_09670 [Nitrosomonas supralitoralis]|uniref:Uncharacterized protein n=1 Tax=Nitrosomonas supralitoralis TaxID=2116706 RepID=A0A2P7NUL2_9PROT|nr:hypothetical protein C7H79_09670 [Nitrosomonas supralitoralis]